MPLLPGNPWEESSSWIRHQVSDLPPPRPLPRSVWPATAVLSRPPSRGRVPFPLKLLYTLFLAVLIPYYWSSYGPQNFLWFCDTALILIGAALWIRSPLLASMQALAIVLPQLLWVIDFAAGFAGFHPLGIASYMFDAKLPLSVRGLSLFHGWLPFVAVWLVARLGYDRRALWAQTLLGWALLLVPYAFDLRDSTGESIN